MIAEIKEYSTRLGRRALVAVALAGLLTGSAIAETFPLQHGLSPDETYTYDHVLIRSDSGLADTPQGDTALLVGTKKDTTGIPPGDEGELRSIVEFDLTSIAAGIGVDPVTSVTLDLWLDSSGGQPRVDGTPKVDAYLYEFDFVEGVSTWNDPDGDGSAGTGDTTPGGSLGAFLGTYGEFPDAPESFGPYTLSSSAALISAVNDALASDNMFRVILVEDTPDLSSRDIAFFRGSDSSGPATLPRLTIETPSPDLQLTIDRDSGAMTLSNLPSGLTSADIQGYSITSASGALDHSNWKTITGNYDDSVTGDGSVDSDDEWTILSDPSSTTDLSEFQFGGTPGDGGSIAISGDVVLNELGESVWIQSPTEDVQIEVMFEDGSSETFDATFVGNSDTPFARSDLNFDGEVDELDWPTMRDNLLTDLSGLSIAQAYGKGDLNGDGLSNISDYAIFKADYDLVNGSGAFSAMLASVPEPSSVLLLALGAMGAVLVRRRKSVRSGANLLMVGMVVAAISSDVSAATFPYLNDFSSAGLPNATPGGNWSHDAPNSQWDLDVNIDMTTGSTTTNISNVDITDIGTNDFLMTTRFSLEALGNPDSGSNAHSVGFAAFAGANDYSTGGYYLADWSLRPEAGKTTVRILELGGDGATVSVNSSTGPDGISVGNTYEMRLIGSYNNMGHLNMTLSIFDEAGDLLGSSATATDTTPLTGQFFGYRNRVVRDSSIDTELQVDYEYLEIDELPLLQALVQPITGEIVLRNASSSSSINMDFYQINGVTDSLDATSWNSLDEQGYDSFGDGLNGKSWDELGGVSNSVLAEAFLQGNSTLVPGETLSIGPGYNTTTADQNLTMNFRNGLSGAIADAEVIILELGDMDGDGSVDTDDVNPFVQALTDRAAYETAHPGVLADLVGDFNGNGRLDLGDISDFKLAVASPGTSSASAVPEPTAGLMFGLGLSLLGLVRNKSNRKHA